MADIFVPSKVKTEESKQDCKEEEEKCKKASKQEISNIVEDKELEEEVKKMQSKMRKDLEKHKSKMKKILIICGCIDVAFISIFWNKSFLKDPTKLTSNNSLQRIFDLYYDTLDCSLIILIRLIFMYYLTNIIAYYGKSESHKNNNNNSRFEAKLMAYILSLWNYISQRTGTGGLHQIPKLVNFKRQTSSEKNETNKMKYLFSVEQVVDKYNASDPQDLADFWKQTIWLILFVILSLFQSYIGVKTVFFMNDTMGLMLLFTLIIIVFHVETYYLKKYIDDITEPLNKFTDNRLHQHPLFYKTTIDSWCDECDNRGQIGDFAYICNKCYFEVCKKCWNKSQKEKKLLQKQKKTDLNKDLTVYEYFDRLFAFHKKYWFSFIFGYVLKFISSITDVMMPVSNGKVFDCLIDGDKDLFYVSIKWYILLTVFTEIINRIQRITLDSISQNVTIDIQKLLYQSVMKQDMSFYDKYSTNKVQNKLSWGLQDMLSPFQTIIGEIINNSIAFIGGVYMTVFYSYRLTLLSLCTLTPISYINILLCRWNDISGDIMYKLQDDIDSFSKEGFEKIKTVRSFAREPTFIKHYTSLQKEVQGRDLKNSMGDTFKSTLRSFLRLTSETLIIWCGGLLVLNEIMAKKSNNIESDKSWNQFILNRTLTVGEMITFRSYWSKLTSGINGLRNISKRLERSVFHAKEIFRTLDNEPLIEQFDENKGIKINDIDGDIKFENVEFTYQSRPNNKVLNGINLIIPKGKTIAFVGPSGGGKTTIIKLLLRYYDATSGNITMNDINIKDLNVYSYRSLVGLVSQDVELFDDTIAFNINFAVDKYNEEDMVHASKLANSHNFVNTFEDKYYSRCGENGTQLSGGQKQRLSIARMLIKKPKLMLLDEATSALDAESEALVQAALEQAMEDNKCTVILVAHRLSTVVNADIIYVINDGKCVESGNHDQLLTKNGIYAKLVSRQIDLKRRMKQKVIKIHNNKDNDKSDNKEEEKTKENIGNAQAMNIDDLFDSINDNERSNN